MQNRFSLSRSNSIYLIVVVAANVGIFLAFRKKGPEELGALTATLISSVVLPSFFSWVIWQFGRRDRSTASKVFNIVLSLLVLTQIGRGEREAKTSRMAAEADRSYAELKKELAEGRDVSDKAAKLANNAADALQGLADKATGDEKKYYEAVRGFIRESTEANKKWSEAVDAATADDAMDASKLKSDADFNKRREVIQNYRDACQTYGDYLMNLGARAEQKMRVVGPDNESAARFVAQIKHNAIAQRETMELLIKAHVGNAMALLKWLDFLRAHRTEWTFDGRVVLKNKALQTEYNEIIEQISQQRARINSLVERLSKGI